MKTKEQGLAKEEKIMFSILGIILLVSIGVLIINSFKNEEQILDKEETPIKETSGQKENIKEDVKEDSIEETEETLIEDLETEDTNYYPIITTQQTSSTSATNNNKKPKPNVLSWSFKDNMVTKAYTGDIITIEKNIVLSNGEEREANIIIMKYINKKWSKQDISNGTLTVSEGTYKYIYSYNSSTKELLLTVTNKLSVEKINILKQIETTDYTSITEEEYNKYQTLISNSLFETINEKFYLTINNYVDTNNLLPIVITTNQDLTNKEIKTNNEGITITKEQQDWYETITPNSILIWLDLNTIENNIIIINLEIDGVTINIELNVTINLYEEDKDDEDQSESDQEITENDSENNEDDIDPLEPTEEDNLENSSINEEISSINEESTQETSIIDISEYSS